MTDGMLDGGYYEQRIAALEAALTEAQKRGDQWATAFHRETEALLAENARLTDALHESQGWALNLVDQRDALATRLQAVYSWVPDGEMGLCPLCATDDSDTNPRCKSCQHRKRLATRCGELGAFASEILAAHTGSLDGCDIEEIGVKHGLLVQVTATEPCSEESCACAEFGFPAECYRRATLAASEPSTPICWRCQEVECECEPSTPK